MGVLAVRSTRTVEINIFCSWLTTTAVRAKLVLDINTVSSELDKVWVYDDIALTSVDGYRHFRIVKRSDDGTISDWSLELKAHLAGSAITIDLIGNHIEIPYHNSQFIELLSLIDQEWASIDATAWYIIPKLTTVEISPRAKSIHYDWVEELAGRYESVVRPPADIREYEGLQVEIADKVREVHRLLKVDPDMGITRATDLCHIDPRTYKQHCLKVTGEEYIRRDRRRK